MRGHLRKYEALRSAHNEVCQKLLAYGINMTQTAYQVLGFDANPFNSNTAEREPEIAAYAVHPPYLDRTAQATGAGRGAFFLEGARGSGKSATRLTVAKQLFVGPGGPLLVSLTGFNVFRPYLKGGISIDLYATQIAFLVAETLLAWLASLPPEEQEKAASRSKSQAGLVSRFISSFYLNRADHSRSSSAKDTYDLLDTSIGGRTLAWAEKRWDQIGVAALTIAGALSKKFADFDIGDPAGFQKLVEQQRGDGFHDPLYTLARAVEVARAFGFTGVVVQIDKVDETDWTGADVAAAADLILPLLTNISLHEIDGLTWSFFVWDEVSRWMKRTHGSKIRFDKIPNGEIVWQVNYLTDLVSRRMAFFSAGRIAQLAEMSEVGIDVSGVLPQVISLTGRSPRQLISALDHILSLHIQSTQGNPRKLSLAAYEAGMDSFATKSLADSGLLEEARTIGKMGLEKFVAKDVQGLIRQSAPTARGRVDGWIDQRLVHQCGTRPTGGVGRPVDEFEVLDPRALRVLHRRL